VEDLAAGCCVLDVIRRCPSPAPDRCDSLACRNQCPANFRKSCGRASASARRMPCCARHRTALRVWRCVGLFRRWVLNGTLSGKLAPSRLSRRAAPGQIVVRQPRTEHSTAAVLGDAASSPPTTPSNHNRQLAAALLSLIADTGATFVIALPDLVVDAAQQYLPFGPRALWRRRTKNAW